MKNLLTRFALLLICLLAADALLTSCDIHKWGTDNDCDEPLPPEPEMAGVLLNLIFDTDLPLHKEVTYSRYGEADHDLRYIVEIFKGSRSKGSSPDYTLVFTRPYDANPDYSTVIELDDGQYDFYVWTDYVDPGSRADKYYDTADFDYIVLSNQDNHQACNERRDAFHGTTSQLVVNAERRNAGNTVDVHLRRPMARFEFIATDIDDFIAREARKRQLEARDISIDDYTVLFQYTGFMPSAFSVYQNVPDDSWPKVTFRGQINRLGAEGASLGFDYVFVNDVVESSLSVIMAIYDAKGQLLTTTSPIDVPLMRSKNTIVRGEFFSTVGSGGVGIVPDFDGDYNIEYQW